MLLSKEKASEYTAIIKNILKEISGLKVMKTNCSTAFSLKLFIFFVPLARKQTDKQTRADHMSDLNYFIFLNSQLKSYVTVSCLLSKA